MEDFAVKFALATMYVTIGGSILAWVLNYIADKMEEISQMTMEDFIGGMIGIGIIIIVALLI